MTRIAKGVGDILQMNPTAIRQVAAELLRVVPIARGGADGCAALIGKIDWVGSGRTEYDGMLRNVATDYDSVSGCYYRVGNALLDFAAAVETAQGHARKFGQALDKLHTDAQNLPINFWGSGLLGPAADWSMGLPDGLIDKLDAETCGGTAAPSGGGALQPLMEDYVTAVNEFESAWQIDTAAAGLIATITAEDAALPNVFVPQTQERDDGHTPEIRDTTNPLQEEAFTVPFLEDTIQQDLGLLYPNAATPVLQPTDVRGPGEGPTPFGNQVAQNALANWNNSGLDVFDNNCANFVSTVLYWSGMPMQSGWRTWMLDDHGNPAPGVDGHPLSTESWYNVPALYNYVTQNGGTQVPVSQAEPGDVVFWETVNPAPGKPALHHTAIVTGITADGQILYTQHTNAMHDAQISQRELSTDEQDGLERIIIVRPSAPAGAATPGQ